MPDRAVALHKEYSHPENSFETSCPGHLDPDGLHCNTTQQPLTIGSHQVVRATAISDRV
jgi:hypothetical protein